MTPPDKLTHAFTPQTLGRKRSSTFPLTFTDLKAYRPVWSARKATLACLALLKLNFLLQA